MSSEYLELQQEIDARFGVMRNDHVAFGEAYAALREAELPALAEAFASSSGIEAARERAAAVLEALRAGVEAAHEGELQAAAGAAREAFARAQPQLEELSSRWSAAVEALLGEVRAHAGQDASERYAHLSGYADFHAAVRQFEQASQAAMQALRSQLERFAAEVEGRMQPDLLQAAADSIESLRQGREESLAEAGEEHRGAFDTRHDEYGSASEEAGNGYLDASGRALEEVGRLVADELEAMWVRQAEELKSAAVQALEREIVESIGETQLSVAISGALTPVMPQLIALYKAVDALEEAIEVWKTAKKLVGA